MSRPLRKPIILASAGLLAFGGALLFIFLRRPPADSPQIQEISPPERPRPVPPGLTGAFEELGRLRAAGSSGELARRYPAFLEELARAWGPGTRDLALYHYDYCRALVMASKTPEALAAAEKALEAWPDCVPLLLLEARLRLQAAVPRGQYDARADRVLRDLLQAANHPRLRGLSADPAAIAARWSEMLFQVGRRREALAAAEAGLSADPRNFECRASRAQILLELERPQEALPIFRDLVAERDTAPLELYLGIAHLRAGEPAPAWERFSRLLKKERTRDEPAVLAEALFADLQLQAARALHQLQRPQEAAEVCLERLLGEPDCEPALHQLASSARALGAAPAADALGVRLRRIQGRQAPREAALRAHHAGQEALVAFHQAQAELAVARTGEALRLLAEARKKFPAVPQLLFEEARVLSLVGRDDLAETVLREGREGSAAAAFAAELARLVAERRGEGGIEARSLLAELAAGLGPLPPGGSQESAEEAIHFTARRARVHLELGEAAAARAVLESAAGAIGRDPAALLARAELAVLDRRFDEARSLLGESYQNLPGGPAWAGALKSCLELAQGGAPGGGISSESEDPSDLLDHPRLLDHPALSGPRVERLRAAHQRRREILARACGDAPSPPGPPRGGGPGRDALSPWREILALYQELKAGRKARETAWYLQSLFPQDLEAGRLLARALSEPDEVVARLGALRSAFRLAPGDTEIRSMLAASRAFLGLAAQ